MQDKLTIPLLVMAITALVLSIYSQLVNLLVYHFTQIDYFPTHFLCVVLYLSLFYTGFFFLLGTRQHLTKISLEMVCFFFVITIIIIATNAVQLTPFPPIDRSIMAFEAIFNLNSAATFAWTYKHSNIYFYLNIIYESLPIQIGYLPLVLLILGRFSLLREYYFLLLATALIGFIFYYFFPTTAPASVISDSYFTKEQIATGLKFREIHSRLTPTTTEGGLIALPSFHCIWALCSVYLLKEWKFLWCLLLLINTLLLCSCFLLGWHYLTDVIAGVLVFFIAYYLLQYIKGRAKNSPALH